MTAPTGVRSQETTAATILALETIERLRIIVAVKELQRHAQERMKHYETAA